MVEVNDASALIDLGGRPHAIGPFMNVYNERTVALLARGGATELLPAGGDAGARHPRAHRGARKTST